MAIALALILIAIIALLTWLTSRPRPNGVANSYSAQKPLSEPEQALYWRLREAMPECVILGQVSFSRFVSPGAGSAGARRVLFNRIAQKTADFLVCLPDFTVVAAVELDDATHRKDQDVRRDAILASAGVPVVRVHVADMPSPDRLRGMFTR